MQQLPEVRKDGRAGVGLHSTEVASSVEVPDGEGVVEKAYEGCAEESETRASVVAEDLTERGTKGTRCYESA